METKTRRFPRRGRLYLFATYETTFARRRSSVDLVRNVNKPCHFLLVFPKLLHLLQLYSLGGEVTRYFTLFFELDSFPLAIITTSFGSFLETDRNGEEGASQAAGGEFVYSRFRVTLFTLLAEVSLVFRPRSPC